MFCFRGRCQFEANHSVSAAPHAVSYVIVRRSTINKAALNGVDMLFSDFRKRIRHCKNIPQMSGQHNSYTQAFYVLAPQSERAELWLCNANMLNNLNEIIWKISDSVELIQEFSDLAWSAPSWQTQNSRREEAASFPVTLHSWSLWNRARVPSRCWENSP